VGDQPYDIIAAHSAGSKAVGALWGAGNLESLMEYRPDYIIKKPGELLSIPDLL
jgi:phosphoglycolate phosphatase-like HAD superfamily hydrolase